MELLGWIWWAILKMLGFVWAVVWFLLGGWVATLAQIGVIVAVIFGYKYGWRQAPQEILARSGTVGRFLWGWVRTRELRPIAATAPSKTAARATQGTRVRARQPGDVNLSTLLSVLALAGLVVAVAV